MEKPQVRTCLTKLKRLKRLLFPYMGAIESVHVRDISRASVASVAFGALVSHLTWLYFASGGAVTKGTRVAALPARSLNSAPRRHCVPTATGVPHVLRDELASVR